MRKQFKLIDQFNEVVVDTYNLIDYAMEVKKVLKHELIHHLETHDVKLIQENPKTIRHLIEMLERVEFADNIDELEIIANELDFKIKLYKGE